MNILRTIWHQFRGTHSWTYEPGETVDGRAYGPWLYCPACGATRVLDAEPPHGHPDSMSVELPEADEEWLAELDRMTWPKESV